MKTLSKSSGLKKLAKLVEETKNSHSLVRITKNSIAYKTVFDLLNGHSFRHMIDFKNNTIRPTYTSGSGRFCSNQDHSSAIKSILIKLGIEFNFTNDSPRGGLTGNLITITTKLK